MKGKKIFTPLKENVIEKLKVGMFVYLNGIIYTARDAAHKKIYEILKNKKQLPFDLNYQIIYYTGPTPPRENFPIGSCGPTTSYRMDFYTPLFLKFGLKGMIGKGKRSEEVKKAILENKAVYFITIPGAGAYLSQFIKKADLFLFPELGPEAVWKLEVVDFPVIVGLDIYGGDLYKF
jgi:fumarate hydratase subunit beta